MTPLQIPPGQSWLRVDLFSPANFGSTGGRATIDRPVALNPWTELPFLPFSGLRGVLAGRLGDVHDATKTLINQERTRIFGGPDGPGSDMVFGDGEMLAFPMPLPSGGIAQVVPLDTLAWLSRLGFLPANVLPQFAGEERAYTLCSGLPPGITTDADPGVVQALFPAIVPIVGAPETLIVAARGAAKILWRHAVEVRTLTALRRGSKQARSGSLRRVELIPAGSIFMMLVRNHSSMTPDMGPSQLQVGGWESWGCGFARITVLATAPPVGAVTPNAAPGGERDVPPEDAKLMVEAFCAIRDAVGDPELRPKLRTILRETGSRLRIQGIPATLAFSLAKAKFGAENKIERKAHRWLLGTFFPEDDVKAQTERAIIGERPTIRLQGLCIWLSRYAELIADGQAEAPEESL